jgi:hypothetical protein
MPPARAIAIAIRDSVTVSIAELTNGTLSRIFLVSGRHHVGGCRQQQDVVEGQAQHRDLVRIITSGGHRVVGEATDADVRFDNQIAAAFKTGQAR